MGGVGVLSGKDMFKPVMYQNYTPVLPFAAPLQKPTATPPPALPPAPPSPAPAPVAPSTCSGQLRGRAEKKVAQLGL